MINGFLKDIRELNIVLIQVLDSLAIYNDNYLKIDI